MFYLLQNCFLKKWRVIFLVIPKRNKKAAVLLYIVYQIAHTLKMKKKQQQKRTTY
jgi:hypothetical protein